MSDEPSYSQGNWVSAGWGGKTNAQVIAFKTYAVALVVGMATPITKLSNITLFIINFVSSLLINN